MRHGFTWCVVVVAAFAGSSHLEAQRGRRQVAEGNRLYQRAQYDSARSKYLEALAASPDSPLIRFNEGNALYKAGAFEKSDRAFRDVSATADSALSAKAWYNLGNNLYRQQQLQESIEAYKQALRLDPQDADAKHNLEFVLDRLNEQQQQQQQDENQRDQNDRGQPPQQEPPQDQDDQRQQDQGDRPQEQEPDQPGQQDSQPAPEEGQPNQEQRSERQMSREEVERLLQAIKENPEEVQRQLRKATRPVRIKKDW